ncbi:MAG TPA: metallophosphoesterase, partial [Chryseosolibacter sp.]|nr:metallophosphoesterase [Chryseosolibacter sp.]
MTRTFVIGDIHGAFRALQQCLRRSAFNLKKDHLIFLGDVVDGWPETRECIDQLLQIDNLVWLMGNHDQWALEWMQTGFGENIWLDQGGKATVQSYRDGVPPGHREFLEHAKLYHVADSRLF